MLNLLLFEDALVDGLDPVTSGRPAWAVSCASYRLVDLVSRLPGVVSSVVRPFLRDVVAADFGATVAGMDAARPWTLCINARTAPTLGNLRVLRELGDRQSPTHCRDGPTLQAALVPTPQAVAWTRDVNSLDAMAVVPATSTPLDGSLELFGYLHDYVRINRQAFVDNLNDRLQTGSWREVMDGVFTDDAAWSPPDFVSLDSRQGPVLISPGVQLKPFAALAGPLFIGPGNRIAAHSAIREYVSTGTTCKLGGEIEASVIESYSNKQHYGFLGHSYLGSWINLGAGTCNSDLKNTYGTVNMRRGGERIATNQQFVGCFIGDYAKTAINTSIFTGKTIGVCSMLYGIACTDVAAFTNHAQSLGQVTAVDPQVMVQTQARMFRRRGVEQRHCDQELISAMFDRTAGQRQGLPTRPLAW